MRSAGPPSSSSRSTRSRARRSRRKGLALATSGIRCTPANMFDMRLNSHSRLSLIRALLDVLPRGADEALMLDPHGFVSSCNATNFFFVRGGCVRTSTGEYCFNGITRANVIGLCHANGIPIQLGNFTLDEVHDGRRGVRHRHVRRHHARAGDRRPRSAWRHTGRDHAPPVGVVRPPEGRGSRTRRWLSRSGLPCGRGRGTSPPP